MDTFEKEYLTVDVGGRLRELRQERNMSMRALARASGLSTNALSMIERGRTSPSVSTLNKLSEALEVPITAFFRTEPPRYDVVFRKAADRKRVTYQNGVWENLGGETFTGRIEPFIVNLVGGSSSGPFGMIHSGHEFIICLKGRLDYEVEDQHFLLEPGDCLLFASRLRHRWHNPLDITVQAMVVLAGFELDERPSEFHIKSGQIGSMLGDVNGAEQG
jgi:transcriptional regulator with XRE-family HTH domain